MSTLSRRASAAPLRTSVSSPLVGIVEGQRAHLTLANTGGRHGHPGLRRRPGAAAQAAGRPPRPRAGRVPGARLERGCNSAIAGHEMVENATQKTTVFIGVYEE